MEDDTQTSPNELAALKLRVDALRLELEAGKLAREVEIAKQPTSPSEVETLNLRVETLRLQLEAEKLAQELTEAKQPTPPDIAKAKEAVQLARLRKEESDLVPVPLTRWWHSWGSVAGVTALITASIPLTTAVLNHRTLELERIKNQHDLDLKTQQQSHQIESARTQQLDEIGRTYLALSKDREERTRVLRFTQRTAPISQVREWADAELKIVEKEFEQLKKELEESRQAALPHRCLKWDFVKIDGQVPESVGRAHCEARADKEMAKKGENNGRFYIKAADGTWQEHGQISLNSVNCKCVESRAEKTPYPPP